MLCTNLLITQMSEKSIFESLSFEQIKMINKMMQTRTRDFSFTQAWKAI